MKFEEYSKTNFNLPLEADNIDSALEGIRHCVNNQILIVVAGNGGSGYTGSHFVQDLTKALNANAKSLNDNWGIYSALSNDIGHDKVFVEQLYRIKERYLFIPISFSGNSNNLIQAVRYTMNIRKLPVLSITGNDGGRLKEESSLNINVPTPNIYVGEGIHSLILHYFIDVLEKK
jgi:D-sedoheptulose 7-phosphate isomerase